MEWWSNGVMECWSSGQLPIALPPPLQSIPPSLHTLWPLALALAEQALSPHSTGAKIND